ncbi:hypothetical protein [Thomasclavelia sp.]|uniref:hypothetical protein n=1 Tax=Thomasclavelia sp. TaxID=3025757 RepID=UPI0025CC05DF|nr:hypothetical protein [Thomasclavelia sp.]
MKMKYESPIITVEEFTVNRAIAACGDETSRPIIFDCMIGDQRDTTSVLTTSCSRKAGTTELKTAQTSGSHDHSNYTGGTWSTSRDTCTYYAPSDAIGLVYFCSASNGANCFTERNGMLVHTGRHSGQYHVQVAPLYGTSVEDVNVGS